MFTKTFATTADEMTAVRVPRDSFVQAGVEYRTGGAGTLQLQGSIDGTNYYVIGVLPVVGGAAITDIVAAGVYVADISVFEWVKIVETVNGTVTATLSLPIV